MGSRTQCKAFSEIKVFSALLDILAQLVLQIHTHTHKTVRTPSSDPMAPTNNKQTPKTAGRSGCHLLTAVYTHLFSSHDYFLQSTTRCTQPLCKGSLSEGAGTQDAHAFGRQAGSAQPRQDAILQTGIPLGIQKWGVERKSSTGLTS